MPYASLGILTVQARRSLPEPSWILFKHIFLPEPSLTRLKHDASCLDYLGLRSSALTVVVLDKLFISNENTRRLQLCHFLTCLLLLSVDIACERTRLCLRQDAMSWVHRFGRRDQQHSTTHRYHLRGEGTSLNSSFQYHASFIIFYKSSSPSLNMKAFFFTKRHLWRYQGPTDCFEGEGCPRASFSK